MTLPVRPVDQLVQVDELAGLLDVALGECIERDADHLLRTVAHLAQACDELVACLEVGGELRELRDRDALVADSLEVDGRVEHREHEPEVGRDR